MRALKKQKEQSGKEKGIFTAVSRTTATLEMDSFSLFAVLVIALHVVSGAAHLPGWERENDGNVCSHSPYIVQQFSL